jgi:hypothetical protein
MRWLHVRTPFATLAMKKQGLKIPLENNRLLALLLPYRLGNPLVLIIPLPKVIPGETFSLRQVFHFGLKGLDNPQYILVQPLKIQQHLYAIGINGIMNYFEPGVTSRKVAKSVLGEYS